MAKSKLASDDHWMARPQNIRLLWRSFLAILAAIVLLDLVVEHHAHFGIDGTFGFAAWFGFLSCVALIVLAKALGTVLKRPDRYYDG